MMVYNLIMGGRQPDGVQPPDWDLRAVEEERWPSPVQPCVAEVWSYDPAGPGGVNIHEGLEIGFALTGSIEVVVGDHALAAGPGDTWLVGMWEPHRWRVIRPYTRVLSVLFIPEFIGEEVLAGGHWQPMFTCPPQDRPSCSTPEMRSYAGTVAYEIAREVENKLPGWQVAVRLTLARFLLALGRSWRPSNGARVRHTHPSLTFDRIMPALAAIRAHPSARLSLAAAAAKCGLSTAHFSRVFAHTMGLSYGRFRIRAHLSYAAHLLLETDLSIDALAERAGFTDASHLHRYFVKHYEITPGEFRLQNR